MDPKVKKQASKLATMANHGSEWNRRKIIIDLGEKRCRVRLSVGEIDAIFKAVCSSQRWCINLRRGKDNQIDEGVVFMKEVEIIGSQFKPISGDDHPSLA